MLFNITSLEIDAWANRLDARSLLPVVLRRLVHATTQRVDRIGFPAREAVQLGGWDGIVSVPTGNAFVPDGQSVWEMGVNQDKSGNQLVLLWI